jgi:hypothetical protein
VSKAFGQAFNAPTKSVAPRPYANTAGGTDCSYSTKHGSELLFRAYVDPSPSAATELHAKLKVCYSPSVPAPGVGDEAYFDRDHAIHVRKGKVRYYLSRSLRSVRMSNTKQADSGPAQGVRRAIEAGPESGRGGKGRWSASRKMSVVLERLRGADLESTSRKYGVTAATLPEWREAFLVAGEEGLKIRQEDLVDEQGRRMKSVIAELAMENELLRERIRRIQDKEPFLRWRSKK